MRKLTTEEFIEKARLIHGDKYDYSKTEYIDAKTKVCIICLEHGEFWQTPPNHLNGQGCKKCGFLKIKKCKYLDTKAFVEKSKKIHGDRYDYSKVNYIDSKTKVCIICPIHGEFWQTPNTHLGGRGCPFCKSFRIWDTRGRITTEEFIEKAKKIHGEKYDYSKVEYSKAKIKIKIICPTHGEFEQTPDNHLKGKGCPLCKGGIAKTTEEFIEKARSIHGDKYDYSKVYYINANTKVCIICPIHGEFWQTPNSHLIGHGCSKCNSSHLEKEIRLFLNDKDIKNEEQKRFDWLGKQSLDFYLPQYNIAIECQGEQHFKKGNWSKNDKINSEIFTYVKERDERKRKLCEEHGIKLLYYSNLGIVYPYKVYEDVNELIAKIKESN